MNIPKNPGLGVFPDAASARRSGDAFNRSAAANAQRRVAFATCLVAALCQPAIADFARVEGVQLGPRPFYLLDQMQNGELKRSLERCAKRTRRYRPTAFSIGHRGAPLQFPEHTVESYVAAARMGAGVLECDVAFTRDNELVCRHSQCDLHTTTDILLRPALASKCSEPFSPARFDADTGEMTKPASARCCTTDLTVDEFLSLEGKMDASDPRATSPEAYVGGTADFRTDLYATGGTLLTHAQSIELFDALGVDMTPELKSGAVDTDGDGTADITQADFALKLIDDYRDARIAPHRVWPQSFNFDDVRTWVTERPRYGRRAVFLDGRYGDVDAVDPGPENLAPTMQEIADAGVTVLAPPMWMLLTTDSKNNIAPSRYATAATQAGLELITWTTERSGRIIEDVVGGGGQWYYQSTLDALATDGDILTTIDVLAQDVGVIGIFSDWPATTTFYANCEQTRSAQMRKNRPRRSRRHDAHFDRHNND